MDVIVDRPHLPRARANHPAGSKELVRFDAFLSGSHP
jgi:hypothetical protein